MYIYIPDLMSAVSRMRLPEQNKIPAHTHTHTEGEKQANYTQTESWRLPLATEFFLHFNSTASSSGVNCMNVGTGETLWSSAIYMYM